MPAQVVSTRFDPEVQAEILRLAKSYKKTPSEIVRLLVQDALTKRAEELTASQFQMVENRLSYMEKRFSAFMVKNARAAAECLFYCEQMVLTEATDKEKKLLRTAAKTFAREFLKARSLQEDQNEEASPIQPNE